MDARRRQALDDLFAYVGTLDAPEALGELQALNGLMARMTYLAPIVAPNVNLRDIDHVMLPLAFALIARLGEEHGGQKAVAPQGEGVMGPMMRLMTAVAG